MAARSTEFAGTDRGRHGRRTRESAPNSAVRSDRRFTGGREYAETEDNDKLSALKVVDSARGGMTPSH
jgi:hypothetical protein